MLAGAVCKGGNALDALLLGLSTVAETAAAELGRKASEDDIARHAVKLNVFHTINFMLQHSEPIRQKVKTGDLVIQGGVYDLGSGRVQFLGESPAQSKLLKSPMAAAPSLKDKLLGA
ncbi:mtcA2 [Symbiodinium natans]|uniref:Carbonic anhydrase n=1 Tax=Symbiodinium natans TaxID=878477 RepID=A0A812UX45_9DINO|nr:mtcA2 [Symbiodinium natans]